MATAATAIFIISIPLVLYLGFLYKRRIDEATGGLKGKADNKKGKA